MTCERVRSRYNPLAGADPRGADGGLGARVDGDFELQRDGSGDPGAAQFETVRLSGLLSPAPFFRPRHHSSAPFFRQGRALRERDFGIVAALTGVGGGPAAWVDVTSSFSVTAPSMPPPSNSSYILGTSTCGLLSPAPLSVNGPSWGIGGRRVVGGNMLTAGGALGGSSQLGWPASQ